MSQFHIFLSLEPTLNATQKRHNLKELSLCAPNTKWKGNKLLNLMVWIVSLSPMIVAMFVSSVSPYSLFQDEVDIDFEDVLNSDTPVLNIKPV